MFILNNNPLPVGVPFEHNGIQYPANWLQLSSQADRTAIGITEVADQSRPDDQYYWVTENADGTYTSTPKDLTQLKANAISRVDDQAYFLLNKTDYMDYRKLSDPTYTPPAAWVTWRAAVRAYIATAKTAVNAATDVPSLQTAIAGIKWPLDPDSAAMQATAGATTTTP
jgi:hypothetical protein